jgi:serine protease
VVAATGPSGALATYSQHGAGVSVAAPGGQPTSADQCSQARCVTSLYPGNQYAVAAGTSMAAPHVAGLAALLFQQKPGRSRADVEQRIKATAHALSGGGAGLIDVAAALGVHRTVASPSATSTRTSSPKPQVAPKPTRPAVHAAGTPSPLTVPKTATPTVTPTTLAPSPTASPVSVTTLAGSGSDDDEVPLGLAGIAGALIGLAGAAVILFGGRRP